MHQVQKGRGGQQVHGWLSDCTLLAGCRAAHLRVPAGAANKELDNPANNPTLQHWCQAKLACLPANSLLQAREKLLLLTLISSPNPSGGGMAANWRCRGGGPGPNSRWLSRRSLSRSV